MWKIEKIDRSFYTSIVEGELYPKKYNKKILKSLKKVNIPDLNLNIGFEFEFFVKDKNLFLNKLSKIIPHSQQILINTESCLKGNLKTWVLTSDSSLSSLKDFEGVELISPILDYKLGFYYLENILKLLNDDNIFVHGSCGLHIHISGEYNNKYKAKYIILKSKELGLLKWKNRKYTRDIYQEIFSYRKKDQKNIFNKVIRKCYNLNLNDLENNHIEYRAIGGENYHKKINLIKNNFLSLIKLFEKTKIKSKVSGNKTVIYINKLNLKKLKKALLSDSLIIN